MFQALMNEIIEGNYEQSIDHARVVTEELLLVNEGLHFNMIAYDQN